MTAAITLTPFSGDGGSGGSAVTLYGNEAAAVAAGSSLVFLGLSSNRASPWEIIGYPGADAIRAKFMGARPRMYSIFGMVVNTTETTMRDQMAAVMALNKSSVYYTVAAGALILHDSTGLICEEVIASYLGSGSGPIWNFEIRMRDLGTT